MEQPRDKKGKFTYNTNNTNFNPKSSNVINNVDNRKKINQQSEPSEPHFSESPFRRGEKFVFNSRDKALDQDNFFNEFSFALDETEQKNIEKEATLKSLFDIKGKDKNSPEWRMSEKSSDYYDYLEDISELEDFNKIFDILVENGYERDEAFMYALKPEKLKEDLHKKIEMQQLKYDEENAPYKVNLKTPLKRKFKI